MSAQLHSISPLGPVIEPDEDLIKLAEALLEQARGGHLKSIGYFTVNYADTITTHWRQGRALGSAVVTGSQALAHRVLTMWTED